MSDGDNGRDRASVNIFLLSVIALDREDDVVIVERVIVGVRRVVDEEPDLLVRNVREGDEEGVVGLHDRRCPSTRRLAASDATSPCRR